MSDIEDRSAFARCSRSDCNAFRANGTPLCAAHLAEVDPDNSIKEPELEARLQRVRTEDDDHPGEVKIWNDDGTSEWVPALESVRLVRTQTPVDRNFIEDAVAGRNAEAAALRRQLEEMNAPQPPVVLRTVWLARSVSGDVRMVCDNELDALRWAVANGGAVDQVEFNVEL